MFECAQVYDFESSMHDDGRVSGLAILGGRASRTPPVFERLSSRPYKIMSLTAFFTMTSQHSVQNYDALSSADHQPALVFTPNDFVDETTVKPAKRRKLNQTTDSRSTYEDGGQFERLLSGNERDESIRLRQTLFSQSWASTEARIQGVLEEANEGVFKDITSFIQGKGEFDDEKKLPAGFIVTGPNISSQELLFQQLSSHLRSQIDGSIILLRSGNALNLKIAMQQIIRTVTNGKSSSTSKLDDVQDQFGRKSMNYDLEALQKQVKAFRMRHVVIAIQDSEAFDTELLSELIPLFKSWLDRIPFVILFGVSTSVALFYDRLPRFSVRCLSGRQFDVEKVPGVLDRIFRKTVLDAQAPLRFGGTFIKSLMAKQKDHEQSVQSFKTALKYAHMCHYFGNELSNLGNLPLDKSILREKLEAVRTLASFRTLVENSIADNQYSTARKLLGDDEFLMQVIQEKLLHGTTVWTNLLRTVTMLERLSPEPVDIANIYVVAFGGNLECSDAVAKLLGSLSRMKPDGIVQFCVALQEIIGTYCQEAGLKSRTENWDETFKQLSNIMHQVTQLISAAERSGLGLRSSHAIRSKGLRTTVIAQRVHLSYEDSSLSEQDRVFTTLVEDLSKMVKDLVVYPKPSEVFLHEVWLYDFPTSVKDVFTPYPRQAIEHALSVQHGSLHSGCCVPNNASATQHSTAILYQMYLQAGSLINIFDLWSTFVDFQNRDEDRESDERIAQVLFYQSLADLSHLGMVRQSKKKADHLTKVMWNGL